MDGLGLRCSVMSTLRPNASKPNASKEEEVKKLHEAGLVVREIARVLDISTQGVYWHLDRLRKKGAI